MFVLCRIFYYTRKGSKDYSRRFAEGVWGNFGKNCEVEAMA
jgi:hypothetical protein